MSPVSNQPHSSDGRTAAINDVTVDELPTSGAVTPHRKENGKGGQSNMLSEMTPVKESESISDLMDEDSITVKSNHVLSANVGIGPANLMNDSNGKKNLER